MKRKFSSFRVFAFFALYLDHNFRAFLKVIQGAHTYTGCKVSNVFPPIEIRDWGNLPFSPFALTTSLIALSGQPSPVFSFYVRTSDSDYWTRARDVMIDAAPVAAGERTRA